MSEIVCEGCGAVTAGYDTVNYGSIDVGYLLSKKPQPTEPPRLNEVLRMIAQLGGFLARKSDGEPGVKTIWQGLQRVMDVATALQSMREGHG